ncbi:MAG TPA: polyprenyl synthetase family protein [bacterium]|nr:polyprenyl synthetase family protein [bacterium]
MSDVRKKYFKYLEENSRKVEPIILSFFREIKKNEKLFEIFEPLLLKRLKHKQLRTTITRLAYQICGGKDIKKILPVCSVMELHNMYAYWHNWIFDNKNSVWDGNIKDIRQHINNIIISAAITREVIIKEINKFDVTTRQKQIIQDALSSSFLELYKGQYIDINLSVDDYKFFKNEEEFLKVYENKSNLQSGSSYGLSGYIGAILAGADEHTAQIIEGISRLLGTGLHISNDLGDFSLPRKNKSTFGKAYQDQMADLRGGRLTWPVFLILMKGTKKEITLIQQISKLQALDKEKMNKVVSIIKAHDISGYIVKYLRKNYLNVAKKKLHESFKPSLQRDMFSEMLSIIRSNKFLVELKR